MLSWEILMFTSDVGNDYLGCKHPFCLDAQFNFFILIFIDE